MTGHDTEPGAIEAAPAIGDGGNDPENMLRHYAGVLRRRVRWIALGVVVGLLAGFVSTLFVKEHKVSTHYFKATNTLVVNGSADPSASAGAGYSLQQAALLVQSQTLIDEVAKVVHLPTGEVGRQLSAAVRSDATAVDLTAIATSPPVAVKLANTAAGLLNSAAAQAAQAQNVSKKAVLQTQLDALQAQKDALVQKIVDQPENTDLLNQQLAAVVTQLGQDVTKLQSLTSTSPNFSMSTLQPATPVEINAQGYTFRLNQNVNARSQVTVYTSTAPTFNETALPGPPTISKSSRVLLGGAAGLVLGVISAFIIEAWDDRIRRREKVEQLTGLPVLAEIPRLSREDSRTHALPVVDSPGTAASERYRAARTAVLFALEDVGAVASSSQTATPHFADDDIGRQPVLPAVAPVILVTSPGPSEGKTTTAANLAAAFADSGLRTLVIDGDFWRPSIRRTIETWRSEYEIVVIDTPPMLTTSDATDLLAAADAVVLVMRSGQTRRGAAVRVSSVLGRFRAGVLGIVLNDCERSDMDPYYGVGYGYLGKDNQFTDQTQIDADRADGHPNESAGDKPSPTTSESSPVGDVSDASDEELWADLQGSHIGDTSGDRPTAQQNPPPSQH